MTGIESRIKKQKRQLRQTEKRQRRETRRAEKKLQRQLLQQYSESTTQGEQKWTDENRG